MNQIVSKCQNVATIGLGSMGYGIAVSAMRDGHNVWGVDINPDQMAQFVIDGGQSSPLTKVVNELDVVIIAVLNAAQTETILFGDDGIVAKLRKGAAILACATVPPHFARAIAARCAAMGVLYLDAPISGGSIKASLGKLSIMASGTPEAFSAVQPVLKSISETVFALGDDVGAGSAMKAVNQLLAGVHIAAASEAIAFAAKQGLDIRKVYEVITASAGNSWMFENRVPHVLDGDYTPRSAVDIFVKDLGIIQDMARTAKFPVPVSAAALQMFLMTSASGMGRDDDASVARMYARVTGTHLPGEPK